MSKIICDICGTSYPETATQCPICGCVLAPDDVVYKNAENEYIGCQECIESREAIELTFENCD